MLSYSIPDEPFLASHEVPVQQLLPLDPPPHDAFRTKPAVPTPRDVDLGHGFRLTTHIVPAAFPRSLPHTPCMPHPSDAGKDGRDPEVIQGTIDEMRRFNASLTANGPLDPRELDRTPQWLCVNRYWRADAPRSAKAQSGSRRLTMVTIPGLGLPKETWEPTIRHLIQIADAADSEIAVDEFWCLENTQHGDTAMLNVGARTGAVKWHDDARDLSQFLAYYLPEHASNAPLPTHLERVPEAVAKDRLAQGFKHRPVVTVAHSWGGCATALTAVNRPALFPTLVLIDPIIGSAGQPVGGLLAYLAIARRDHWPDRQAARASLARQPFFAAWEPAALDLYIECGLCADKARGGVTLKMTRIQEALICAEEEAFAETWQRLKDLPDGMQLHYIMPTKMDGYAMDKQRTSTLVWRKKVNASNVRIPESGHLMPQENPQTLAQELHRYFSLKYGAKAARL